jgi:glycosyltransferase involved in cell wall biosynthesis
VTTISVPVSVVIPIYGHIDVLERAIKSVLLQTWQPDELILVIDGAKPAEKSIIEVFIKNYDDKWISLLYLPENRGAGYARNIGWNQAKNSLIAFLDADDAWHPKKIEIQYQIMSKNPNIKISGHEHRVEKELPNWQSYKITENYRFIKLFTSLLRNPFITPSVMLRKSIEQRFDNTQRYSEDYRLWLEMIDSGHQCIKIDAQLACIFKPSISKAGLSSHLLAMELGELSAYWSISKNKNYKILWYFVLTMYSSTKFIRRFILHKLIRN